MGLAFAKDAPASAKNFQVRLNIHMASRSPKIAQQHVGRLMGACRSSTDARWATVYVA